MLRFVAIIFAVAGALSACSQPTAEPVPTAIPYRTPAPQKILLRDASSRDLSANALTLEVESLVEAPEMPATAQSLGDAVVIQPEPPSPRYGPVDVPALAMAAVGDNWLRATRVAFCESGLDPNATGAVGERGLWQIHPLHADSTYDPAGNAAAMARISAGGTTFSAWAGGLGNLWAEGEPCPRGTRYEG